MMHKGKQSKLHLAAFTVLLWHNVFIPQLPNPAPGERDVILPDISFPDVTVIDAVINPIVANAQEDVVAPVVSADPADPIRIRIPTINVDAAIGSVGLTDEGAMDVPKNPVDTGWYEGGPRPGEAGSAAIAGHVDWLNGGDAVFTDLDQVKPGDMVMVENGAGEISSFVVREVRTYDPTADATEVFSSTDGESHLNLITCSGVWDTGAMQYSERLVVFTDKVI